MTVSSALFFAKIGKPLHCWGKPLQTGVQYVNRDLRATRHCGVSYLDRTSHGTRTVHVPEISRLGAATFTVSD